MNTRMRIWSAAALLLASGASAGVAYASTSGGEPAPSAYTSWKAQVKAQADCVQKDSGPNWEACLVGSWNKSTKSQLSPVEYTLNRSSGTWKVTWSHVTLPSGGKALKKGEKVAKGIPATVYCKTYTKDVTVVLCNNGFRV